MALVCFLWDGKKIIGYSPTFQYNNMWIWLCATNIAIAAALLKQWERVCATEKCLE